MTAQAKPHYLEATKTSDPIIVKELCERYGYNNVIWPIVLSKNETTICYYYERNFDRLINSKDDNRPSSSEHRDCFYIDFTVNPRLIFPRNELFVPFIDAKYKCSYDYIIDSPYSSVDLDYAWKRKNDKWVGMELTTFYLNFINQSKAEDLIMKFNRRPSWQGKAGAHALRRIVAAAEDLGIEYYLVCVNTVSKVGSEIKTNGNVYFFRLNNKQIDKLVEGEIPKNAVFCSFGDFLEWL